VRIPDEPALGSEITVARPIPFQPANTPPLIVRGARGGVWTDLYYFLLTARWASVFGLVFGAFLLTNALFAIGFLMTGGIHGARPGSFEDVFFFSVQTFGTIGYGAMYPESFAANTLVSVEALLGLLWTPLIAGLAFAKFSKPRARILFSKHAVISLRDGVPTLMVRVANERRNAVAEATMRLAILKSERTAEGEFVRRIIDLPMVRSQTPAFVLTWTGMHPVTPDSPFFNATPEQLKAGDIQLLVNVIGHDETFAQTIHARFTYRWDGILWNKRFADVMRPTDDGRRMIDYTHFHEIEEMPSHLRIA
jgi:inward rectifier potassium channel